MERMAVSARMAELMPGDQRHPICFAPCSTQIDCTLPPGNRHTVVGDEFAPAMLAVSVSVDCHGSPSSSCW